MAKRRRTSRRWIENGPLATWMTRYAQWLASQPGAELSGSRADYRSRHPTSGERSAKASFFATRVVQVQLVSLLEKRQDFRDYFERLQQDAQYHAKELFRQDIAENIDSRRAGLRAASGRIETADGKVTYNVQDLKALEHYTRPVVELAFPKKVNEEPQVQKFTINLFGASPEQKKLLLSAFTEEPDEIDFEIIPNEKQLGDGDDD